MRKPLPDASVLKDLLAYDLHTGAFVWKERRPEHFEATEARTPEWACRWWNSRFAGQTAGFTDPNGYLLIRIGGVDYRAHRMAWVYIHGSEPDTIDHVDGNRANNRIGNLRNVDATGNARNAKRRDDNASGTTGVGFYPKTSKWRARINRGGKTVLLGYFGTKAEAIMARKRAESEAQYAPRHGQP
jgi:hypothetical protein